MIDLYAYNTQTKSYIESPSLASISSYLENEAIWLWADFSNPTEAERELLKSAFKFDEYAIEDCVHPRQLPKLESFKDYHFFIVQGISLSPQHQEYSLIELDGFLGDRYLVTYHEEAIQAVDNAKKHIVRQNSSRLTQGTAYLAYEILDQMIDMYLPVLDHFDEKIHAIQKKLQSQSLASNSAEDYMNLSTHINTLRRTAIKNQQVFYQFSHSHLHFIDPDEARLFRDIYDHVVRVADMSDYYQQSLREALNIQFSLNASKVNQVVLFLTVFSTIMLPLNVLTGIYGMNFSWMPLLDKPYGFWVIFGLMLAVVLGMLYSFQKRKWL